MSFYLSAIFGLLTIMQAPAQSPTPQEYPPPGRLIDTGGRKLHLYCIGKGSPTVVLVTGGGAFSIDWALVQPKVAQETRVCSCDRAGLASSDPGPADETIEQTVSDLHVLLNNAGERSPYLLVGASIGGMYIQAYQRAFPKEVAGLAFTNSSNRIARLVNGNSLSSSWRAIHLRPRRSGFLMTRQVGASICLVRIPCTSPRPGADTRFTYISRMWLRRP